MGLAANRDVLRPPANSAAQRRGTGKPMPSTLMLLVATILPRPNVAAASHTLYVPMAFVRKTYALA